MNVTASGFAMATFHFLRGTRTVVVDAVPKPEHFTLGDTLYPKTKCRTSRKSGGNVSCWVSWMGNVIFHPRSSCSLYRTSICSPMSSAIAGSLRLFSFGEQVFLVVVQLGVSGAGFVASTFIFLFCSEAKCFPQLCIEVAGRKALYFISQWEQLAAFHCVTSCQSIMICGIDYDSLHRFYASFTTFVLHSYHSR